MKLRRIITSLILGFTMIVGGIAPAYALAHDDDSGSVSTESTEHESEHEEEIEREGSNKANIVREAAKNRLSELKSKVEERTKEVRVKVCDNRKSAIVDHLDHIADKGKHHKEKFDNILERIEAFVAKKNLTVENLDAQKANITIAEEKVATEVATLRALKGNIDCNDPDSVAEGLDAFKTQAAAVREALKEYREAIRAYLKAVKVAAEAAEAVSGESDDE